MLTSTSHCLLRGKWPPGQQILRRRCLKESRTCAVASRAPPPPEHVAAGKDRPFPACFQRPLSPSPTAPTCQSEFLSFANLIYMLICMILPWSLIWWLVMQNINSNFIVEGLSVPAAFCHLEMLPQPSARAWPRLKEDTHPLLFMISFPEKTVLSQFMQITMQISTADFITVSCQNVDAKYIS